MPLFFELIRVAMGNQECLSQIPNPYEWMRLYHRAKQQTLVGVLYSALEKLPVEQRPPKNLLLQWFMATERLQLVNHELNRQCGELTAFFKKEGRRSVILKGQGIAQFYPQPLLRTSGDIDIWVEGNRKGTLELLQRHGVYDEVTYHHCDFRVFKDTAVEVHFCPSWMYSPSKNRILQKYFNQCRDQEMGRHNVFSLEEGEVVACSNAFNRVYLLVHIYRHLFHEGIGLRQLMDYYYVLVQGCTGREKAETVAMLKKLGMLKFCAAVMYVLQTVFGMNDRYLLVKPNVKEGKFLLSEVMLAGNFGKFDQRIRRKNKGNWALFVSHAKRNVRFLWSYPGEVAWSPVFKLWHYWWRKGHGWI